MLRRLIAAALAAGVAAPLAVFTTVTPAHAVVLGSCSSASGNATLTPGLGHTPQAQTDVDSTSTFSGCTGGNGQTGGTVVSGGGSFPGATATTSFPPRPLACPRALAGDDGHQGPEYADQTPTLLSGDPGFRVTWTGGPGGVSTGITKVKSTGPATPGTVRVVLVITSGEYFVAGKKTKIKGKLDFVPDFTQVPPFDCSHAAGNSAELREVLITNNGSFILQRV